MTARRWSHHETRLWWCQRARGSIRIKAIGQNLIQIHWKMGKIDWKRWYQMMNMIIPDWGRAVTGVDGVDPWNRQKNPEEITQIIHWKKRIDNPWLTLSWYRHCHRLSTISRFVFSKEIIRVCYGSLCFNSKSNQWTLLEMYRAVYGYAIMRINYSWCSQLSRMKFNPSDFCIDRLAASLETRPGSDIKTCLIDTKLSIPCQFSLFWKKSFVNQVQGYSWVSVKTWSINIS